MNTTTPYFDILRLVRTKRELDLLNREIEVVLNALYQVEADSVRRALTERVRLPVAQAIEKLLLTQNVSLDNRTALHSILMQLRQHLVGLPSAQLILAIDPTEDIIHTISQYVRTSLHPELLLEIKKDERILGGVILVYQGKYRDYSAKSRLDRYFTQRKAEVLHLLP